MQEKLDPNSEFSERTEAICRQLALNLSDLPAKIGVSPAMFFSYRSGQNPISKKAWRKLEAFERSIGAGSVIAETPGFYGTSPPNPKKIAEFLREEARRLHEKADQFSKAADMLDPPDTNELL